MGDCIDCLDLQAEARLQAVMDNTAATLFEISDGHKEPTEEERNLHLPSYILMSDSFRLRQPPRFRDWQESFVYLSVKGRSALAEAPDEHIQIRPPVPHSQASPDASIEDGPLMVKGTACSLGVDTSDPPQEEIILADGEMEEVLEEDHQSEGEEGVAFTYKNSSVCLSPRSTRLEEVKDALMIRSFFDLVIPLATSFVEGMFKQRQEDLRASRELQEEKTRQAAAQAKKEEDDRRFQEQQEAEERARHEADQQKALEEERIREEERRQELLRQRLEENDEEEIKIRTLAYSHTREWYQPNKKCFKHRGRQLTYLKPVRNTREVNSDLDEEANTTANSLNANSEQPRNSQAEVRMPIAPPARPHRRRRRIRASSAESDVRPSPKVHPPPASLSSRTSNEADYVRLPNIYDKRSPRDEVNDQKVDRSSLQPLRVRSPPAGPFTSASVAAPTRVYSVSPYRVPPPLLRSELSRDETATMPRQRPANKSKGSDI
ncbi:hypothetical protein PINS_up009627 [Pythium insidiosum]|nr:hypothetical protein PINS_up009627 [Pythium insidiosum]